MKLYSSFKNIPFLNFFKMDRFIVLLLSILLFVITSCNAQKDNKKQIPTNNSNPKGTVVVHCTNSDDDSKNCNCPSQFELEDSLKLTQIKEQFYKSETGHLYEKTWSQRQLKGQDTLRGYFILMVSLPKM